VQLNLNKYNNMKKLFFAMACVLGLMFFASCDPEIINELMEQKPNVEFVTADGCISNNTSVYFGTDLNFQVKVSPNASSQSPLAHFDFSITDLGGKTWTDNPEITDPNGEMIFSETFSPEAASTYVITATITDENNKANIASITVDCVIPVEEGIGTYAGMIDINGHITSNEIAGQSYDEDYSFSGIPVEIILGENVEGGVNATFEVEGAPVTLYGTMEDNTIHFNDFHFYKDINLLQTVLLKLNMDMTAVLSEDHNTLTLSGPCDGEGSTQVVATNFKVEMTGVIDGTLTRK
jgi:hypothetical protein